MQQCAAINNDLVDLKQEILSYRKDANKMIIEVIGVLTMPKFKDNCYDEFIDDSNRFQNMVDELITTLDKAIENAIELENWKI